MAAPLQLSTASTATSGVKGDTALTSPTNYTYSAPFAVGSGATASAEQSGGLSTTTVAIVAGGLVLVGLIALVAFRPRPRKK